MIKRILVALDPDDDTPVATNYAIRLAKRFDASLTGLAVIDTGNIPTNIGVGGFGAEYYGQEVKENLSAETREIADNLIREFHRMVEKAGVNLRTIKREGTSWRQIIDEMKYHDLLVVGRDSRFFYNEPYRNTDTLAQVVRGGVAPALVVTDEYRDIEKVLIAFDGSNPSARSLKSFVHLLPYGKDIDIDLLYVCEKSKKQELELASSILGKASTYLRDHNFNYINQTILEKGTAADEILKYQEEKNPDLVLLGAHSVSALRRAAFGSTTHELITKSKGPLFLSP